MPFFARCLGLKGTKPEGWNHHLDTIPLSDGKGLKLIDIELPSNGLHRLSVACSISSELIQRWENHFGDPTPQAMHTLCKSPTVFNVAATNDPLDETKLLEHNSKNHRVYLGGRSDLLGLLEKYPDIWVQDAASSHVVEDIELGNMTGLIVDLCAGKGTKTRQLPSEVSRGDDRCSRC